MRKIFTITTLLFLYSTLNVKAQNLFNQDFTPSNTLADYFNATSVTGSQLDYISNLGSAPASVSGGIFSWNKVGADDPAFITKNTSFAGNPTFLKFQMRVRFSPPENLVTGANGTFNLCIGDGTSGTWNLKNSGGGAVPGITESFARVDFLYNVSLSAVTFRAGSSSIFFSGWQDITMFCNKGTGEVSYLGPDNEMKMISGGSSDLWIGTTRVRESIVSTSSVDLKKFKIILAKTAQNMKIEIDYIKVWDESVLPVKLIDFKAESKSGYNKLFWSTASETNNSHFNIYKSNDGESFSLLTKVNGKGNTNSVSNYSYSDKINSGSEAYYKLEQVDFDGRAEELKTVFLKSSLASASYYVNIKDDNIGVFSTSNNISKVKNVKVYNVSGSTLVNQTVNARDKILISKNLDKGVYVLQLFMRDGRTEVLKFVK